MTKTNQNSGSTVTTKTTGATQAPSNTAEQFSDKTCEECNTELTKDTSTGEHFCPGCGYIPEDQSNVDLGKEWRSFDGDKNKSRVGMPSTNTLHDKGLSTKISWKDVDSRGNNIAEKKQARLNRMRKWDTYSKVKNSEDRSNKKGLTEIHRIASALGLTNNVKETASMIFRQSSSGTILKGRSIEGVATASVYLAAHIENIPRTFSEFEVVSRVDIDRVKQAQKQMRKRLNLEIKPTQPEVYIPRFGNKLGFSAKLISEAQRLTKNYKEQYPNGGERPSATASIALYVATITLQKDIKQLEIAEELPISPVSLRKKYKKFIVADNRLDYSMEEIKDTNVISLKKKLNEESSE